MSKLPLDVPIVFVIFNRPSLTRQVFDVIRQVKPSQLFVIADGYDGDDETKIRAIAETRRIIDEVNWECEVRKNYSETNLGCARRVSSGLDWIFEQVEEAIILEDDCVPDLAFFWFCEELLEKYRFDDRIFSISAQNFYPQADHPYSYTFSQHHHCWGWATWKRAWNYFDFDMKLWSEVREKNLLQDIFCETSAIKSWNQIFKSTYSGEINSWAYRWSFACLLQNALSIHPKCHLVTNIGFGDDATHTTSTNSSFAHIKTQAIESPLKHPPFIVRDVKADHYIQQKAFQLTGWQMTKSLVKDLIMAK